MRWGGRRARPRGWASPRSRPRWRPRTSTGASSAARCGWVGAGPGWRGWPQWPASRSPPRWRRRGSHHSRTSTPSSFVEDEQDQPEFEFHHGSLDAFVRPVNVGRPVNGGTPRNSKNDAFFGLQDSLSVASNSEAEDAGGHERWWKRSSPLGTSVGTPGAEFYDAFEEMSRQQRNKRKKRQKWFWGSVGLAVTFGAAAIAWSYLPAAQPQASPDSNSTNSD